jgi:transcriptional regulator with XRE-family HTH domain
LSQAREGLSCGQMTRVSFGEQLKTLLEERDMSQVELAKALHLGKSTVSQYISGTRTPDLATLKRIAEFFTVSLDFLLGQAEVRWPAVVREPDVELAVRRLIDLHPEDRKRLLDYMDYLRFERRRKDPPAPPAR